MRPVLCQDVGVAVREKGGLATGVPEEDSLVLAEEALANQINQPCGRAASVDGIEQQALAPGKQADSLALCACEDTVACAAILIIGEDILGGEFDSRTKLLGCSCCQAGDVRRQPILGFVDADTKHSALVAKEALPEREPNRGVVLGLAAQPAAAAPPLEPPQVSAVFHGLRVAPNTALKVWLPAANSGVSWPLALHTPIQPKVPGLLQAEMPSPPVMPERLACTLAEFSFKFRV